MNLPRMLSRRRCMRRYLWAILCCSAAAQYAGGAEPSQTDASANPAPQTAAADASGAEAAKPSPSGENDVQKSATSADEFDPSESLSEDVTVAFPVDI
jgi:hypothetical protein